MPFINLIQEQRLAIKRDERTARTYFAGFAGAAAAAILSYGFLMFRTERAGATEAKMRVQLQAAAPMERQIAADDLEEKQLQPRLDMLTSAETMSDKWSHILKHIATQTPPTAWLTDLKATNSDASKPIVASFDGVATAQAPISEYLFRLENLPDLDNVTLKFTQQKMEGSVKQTQFSIEADIAGTATPKAPEKKV
jgi:Tfp pilus assembly protein PilN